MADELSISVTVKYSKSGTVMNETHSDLVTVSGTKFFHHRQQIGITEEVIQLAEVTASGYCLAINRDPTNFLQIRMKSGSINNMIKLKAGEIALFRWGSDAGAPFAQADTAAAELEIWSWSD